MKIFLDDYRIPLDCIPYMYQRIGNLNPIYQETWKVVRNYNEFVDVITSNYKDITHISFDHDLADFHYRFDKDDYEFMSEDEMEKTFGSIEKDGLDCAKWVKEFYNQKNIELPIMFVHSMNPVGTKNIINLFKDGQ